MNVKSADPSGVALIVLFTNPLYLTRMRHVGLTRSTSLNQNTVWETESTYDITVGDGKSVRSEEFLEKMLFTCTFSKKNC